MPMTSDEYVASGGNHCPSCGSEEINTGTMQTDAGVAWQSCECECGAEWTDQYKLVGYKKA